MENGHCDSLARGEQRESGHALAKVTTHLIHWSVNTDEQM